MNFSSRISRPLLYQEVVSALYQIIDEQKIQPSAQLPSERELIERLGVSRNVLREAFQYCLGLNIMFNWLPKRTKRS